MGYFRNECMVISGESDPIVLAHKEAVTCFTEAKMPELVSAIIPHAINGGAAFFIAPDGSKEGFPYSNEAAKAREQLISKLRSMPSLEWALILLGGDDGEYRVLQATNDPASAEADVARPAGLATMIWWSSRNRPLEYGTQSIHSAYPAPPSHSFVGSWIIKRMAVA
jgi:hypothetical protein